jgi:hypothetical protein
MRGPSSSHCAADVLVEFDRIVRHSIAEGIAGTEYDHRELSPQCSGAEFDSHHGGRWQPIPLTKKSLEALQDREH